MSTPKQDRIENGERIAWRDDWAIRKTLKGLRLTSKDAITDYAEEHFSYRELSDELGYIVAIREKQHNPGWSPRSTWLIEYRQAIAVLIQQKHWTAEDRRLERKWMQSQLVAE